MKKATDDEILMEHARNPVREGVWSVLAVTLNSSPAGMSMGFQTLVSLPNSFRLEPAGVEFRIQQANQNMPGQRVILESRSQIFFAEFVEHAEELEIILTRPAFSERILLRITYEQDRACAGKACQPTQGVDLIPSTNS